MSPVVDALIPVDGPRPRADARRNVELLVAAARAALDKHGLAVTTRELAAAAGVGLGTVHRRIPSMQVLLAAILTDSIDEMTARAQLAGDDPDIWHGFTEFAAVYVQLRSASCGLHDALSGRAELDIAQPIARLSGAIRRLVRRGQRAGVIRGDIDWRDVPFTLASAIPPDHTIGLVASTDQWRRNLRIILDGLRAR